jgi:hypothetical protein
MSDRAALDKTGNIEVERAAYITGHRQSTRLNRIRKIWDIVRANKKRFRGPGHHKRSEPIGLLESSPLQSNHQEIDIEERSGRDIFYHDTITGDFRKAAVQIRLEHKKKIKEGELTKEFDEVTIKIGSKADQRLEDSVKVDLTIWELEGFYVALQQGIKNELKELDNNIVEKQKSLSRRRKKADNKDAEKALEKAKDKRNQRKQELDTLLNKLKEAMGEGNKNKGYKKLKETKTRALVHLQRQTIETIYSPGDSPAHAFEMKTDDCAWVTALGGKGGYAQLEIEDLSGHPGALESQLAFWEKHKDLQFNRKSSIRATSDSKPDRALDAWEKRMKKYVEPRKDSETERERVRGNIEKIEEALPPVKFKAIQISQISGLRA